MKRTETDILEALSLSKREIISIIGGGGKTSLAACLSKKLHSLNKMVISTTTTKIFPPHTGKNEISLFTTDYSYLNSIDAAFRKGKLVHLSADILPSGKLKGLSVKSCKKLLEKSNVDYLIIEGDGSRGKSIKAHSRWEPVVPDFTTLFIPVIGIDCLYKRIDKTSCHRPDTLCSLLNVFLGDIINTDLIVNLFRHPEGYLKKSPLKARIFVFINKIHCEEELGKALDLGKKLLTLEKISGILIGRLKPVSDKIILLVR